MSVLPPPRSEDLVTQPAAYVAPPSPAGWYPDHADAKRERWWDGAEWTDATHRRPGPGMFGDAYTRSTWAGANRIARMSQLLNVAALASVMVALFAVFPTFSGDGSVLPSVVAGALGIVLGGAGLVCAIVALGRAGRLGARALAIHQIVAGSLAILLALGITLMAVAGLSR